MSDMREQKTVSRVRYINTLQPPSKSDVRKIREKWMGTRLREAGAMSEFEEMLDWHAGP